LLLMLGALVVPALVQAPGTTLVTPGDQAEMRRFVSAKFEGRQTEEAPATGLIVRANNDPVQLNSRAGRALNIAGQEYTRGLYCHAVSDVVVRLPGPGARLTAVVGVDSNDNTRPGRGSVVFSVSVGGRRLFESPLLSEGMAAVPVDVDLGGATEFPLEVGDGGDGISCDQSDWADARVTLTGGEEVWLGDLPIVSGRRAPYSTTPPFSFRLGDRDFAQVLAESEIERGTRELDADKIEHTLTLRHAVTGLEARCVAVEYRSFPTVEWTLYLRNTGDADTPVISDVLSIDTRFERDEGAEFVLQHQTGSLCIPTDYEPFETVLKPDQAMTVATSGGRSSNTAFPFFRIAGPPQGLLMAVGWPGQWATRFERDGGFGLQVRSGQELTHFVLHAGEEVRAPLIALQFFQGDALRAHNIWRRWMLAYGMPRPHGEALVPQTAACSSHQFGEMIHANDENQKLFIDRYLEEQIRLDYWWMDAGWYVNESGWPNTGTWEVDRVRFPGGLRSITDHGHSKGVRSIVWFEPERVTAGTWLWKEHPDWLLGSDGGTRLLNLGNPEALDWLISHVNGLIDSEGIDLYRNDYNIDPLGFWRENDAEDRQGITEIRYVEGFLAFWDGLLEKHPHMLIDTCASGGRRNDLESLRRSVPLLRSDYILEPVGQQLHTYGLAQWVPFYGTGVNTGDPYTFRSTLCAHMTFCYDMRNREYDYEPVRERVAEWERLAPFLLADYYPLTRYQPGADTWMAWQFNSPETGGGMVQAFRRAESIYESARLRLHGLDAGARYEFRNIDTEATEMLAGAEAMDLGISVPIGRAPGAAIVEYHIVGAGG